MVYHLKIISWKTVLLKDVEYMTKLEKRDRNQAIIWIYWTFLKKKIILSTLATDEFFKQNAGTSAFWKKLTSYLFVYFTCIVHVHDTLVHVRRSEDSSLKPALSFHVHHGEWTHSFRFCARSFADWTLFLALTSVSEPFNPL